MCQRLTSSDEIRPMCRLRVPGLLLLFACAIGTLRGQSIPPDQVIHLDIKGLPLATIRAMAKDREGFLWIGTENGLCRYDGINVDVYRTIPGDSTSLPGNFVQDLLLDGEGRIWISCFGGIAVFDPHLSGGSSGPGFKRKSLFVRGQHFSNYEAVDLLVDNEGGLWATCAVNGLARYSEATDQFHEAEQLREAVPPEQTTANALGITCDAGGAIWAVNWLSLYRFDPGSGTVLRYTFSSSGHTLRECALLFRVTQDPFDQDIPWIGSWGLGLCDSTNALANEMIRSIRGIQAGGSPMSLPIARMLVDSVPRKLANASLLESLTKRERELLDLLAEGYRYKEIGDKLELSIETVRTYIRAIYTKLQMHSRTDALNKVFAR